MIRTEGGVFAATYADAADVDGAFTAIRGFAETLRDGAIDDPVAAKRFLDVILRHTLRLQALVAETKRHARELVHPSAPATAGPPQLQARR